MGISDTALTVGIDARTLTFGDSTARGIGHYTFYHLAALFRSMPESNFHLYIDGPQTEPIEAYPFLSDLLTNPNTRLCQFERDESRYTYQLFHIPDPMSLPQGFDSPFRVVPSGIPLSLVFYDLIPLVLSKFYFDSWSSSIKTAYLHRLEDIQRSPALILSISENSALDLQRLGGISAERIVNIGAGYNEETLRALGERDALALRERLGIRHPFFLFVGNHEPHKNFITALNAHLTVCSKQAVQLVVVGTLNDPYKLQHRNYIEQQQLPGVVFTDYLSREELHSLYQKSQALLFPSHYEGFGFPVLEAMANNCPVICSNTSSLPEVAGDAAIQTPAEDFNAIARAMLELLHSPHTRQALQTKARIQTQKFTWPQTAKKTQIAWQQLIK